MSSSSNMESVFATPTLDAVFVVGAAILVLALIVMWRNR